MSDSQSISASSQARARIVIWPQPAFLLSYGIAGAAILGIGLAVILDQLGRGHLEVAVSLIVMQAFFGLAFLSLASQRLSTDGERVVKRGLFVGGSCRCDQLDHIEIGEPYSRMGRSYRFIRKDATLAFTGNTAVWKKSRVKKMAAALGVPFTEASGGAPGTLES